MMTSTTTAQLEVEQKLLLIDGLSVLYAVFRASDITDIDEKVEAACHSAYSTFTRLLDTHRPTHALVVYDAPGKTFRHRLWHLYRSSRAPMPDQLRAALPAFFSSLKIRLGLASVSIDDVEADDVIGTMVYRWRERVQGKVIVVTSDKDLLQLVPAGAVIYHPFKREFRDADWVLVHYGVPADRFIDYLSLVGDSTDDVPGVEGIGAKTAPRLINTYGDVCALLDAATTMSGSVGQHLRNGSDMLVVSRMLVGLRLNVQVGVTLKQLEVLPPVRRAA